MIPVDDYHQLMVLLCPDFPRHLIDRALTLMDTDASSSLPFAKLSQAVQTCFFYSGLATYSRISGHSCALVLGAEFFAEAQQAFCQEPGAGNEQHKTSGGDADDEKGALDKHSAMAGERL